jgi:Domain of unknown function (DUF4062)/inactive STAND
MAKIYISSTYKDLIGEREAAAKAVRRLGHQTIAMEDYVATDDRPVNKCLADVRACEAYVGIIAWRYGSIPDGYDKSITHLEYEEAGKAKIPRLLFVVDDTAPWPHDQMDDDDAPIKIFRRHLLSEHLVSLFSTRDELSALVGAALSRAIGADTKPTIPHLLPYLSDRSEQENELGQALEFHHQNRPRRPFVCIIHGDEYECHDMFLERLQRIMLPQLLKLDNEHATIKDYLLQWPASAGTRQNRLNVVRSNLATALVGNSAAPVAEIIAALSRHETPVMIHTHLFAEDWPHDGPGLIAGFFDFWKNWSDLAPGQFLFICLCVKYKSLVKLGFWERRKFKRLNDAIRRFLIDLNFAVDQKIHGVTLPELRAISHREVVEWVHMHAREFCHIDELLPKIRALYEQTALRAPEGGICMERLAVELKKLLQ